MSNRITTSGTKRRIRRLPALLLALLAAALCCSCARNAPDKVTNPNEISLHLDLAEAHMGRNELPQAMQELNIVAKSATQDPRFHFDMGLAKFALNRYAEAEASLREAVRLKPDYGEAWNNLGWVCYSAKRYDQAIAAFTKATEILTYLTPERAYYGLAVTHKDLKDLAAAEADARTSMARNWTYVPAYTLLNQILLDSGRPDEAMQVLLKGAESAPGNPTIVLMLAESYMRLGQNGDAKMWLERLLELSPNSPEARTAKDYLDILR